MGNTYLIDLAKSVHRGQTGKVLSGTSAGGLPYGYRVTRTGEREVVPEQAEIIRRIYREFAAGASPRRIAAGLNADRIPTGRGASWSPTAIYADKRRGIGILSNPVYVGKPVWNRSRWIKHPDTGRRVRRERPESEWLQSDHPELAIVDADVWESVQARIEGKRASRAAPPTKVGRPPKNLLSGLLRCGECGGPIVIVDARAYGCSRAKERGTCPSRLRICRRAAEEAMLRGVREQLLTEVAFDRFRRQVTATLRMLGPSDAEARKRLIKAERERQNIANAIRAGILTPTTRAELLQAETAIEEAKRDIASAAAFEPTTILPRARAVWQGIVDDLSNACRNNPEASNALRVLLGESITVRTNENGDPVAEIAEFLPQIKLVAGARSEHYLPEPLLIPLKRRAS